MLVEHVHSVRSIYCKMNCGYSSRTAFICLLKKKLSFTHLAKVTEKIVNSVFYPIILLFYIKNPYILWQSDINER